MLKDVVRLALHTDVKNMPANACKANYTDAKARQLHIICLFKPKKIFLHSLSILLVYFIL